MAKPADPPKKKKSKPPAIKARKAKKTPAKPPARKAAERKSTTRKPAAKRVVKKPSARRAPKPKPRKAGYAKKSVKKKKTAAKRR